VTSFLKVTVLREVKIRKVNTTVSLTTDTDLPFPWEKDPRTGEFFPDDYIDDEGL
jgi:hypothetical protein